jgi:hypothetical protein
MSGHAADMAKPTRMTQSGHATINFAVMHKALSHLVW